MRKPAEPKWILLSRQHDGAWTCGNMEPVFKPEANRTEKISRIIFGIQARLYLKSEHIPCRDCREEVDSPESVTNSQEINSEKVSA